MKMKKIILLGVLCLCFPVLRGQEMLRLTDALALALEKNFDLRIVGVDKESARIQNTPGEAGILPRLSLDADLDAAQRDSRQEFVDGRDRKSVV